MDQAEQAALIQDTVSAQSNVNTLRTDGRPPEPVPGFSVVVHRLKSETISTQIEIELTVRRFIYVTTAMVIPGMYGRDTIVV